MKLIMKIKGRRLILLQASSKDTEVTSKTTVVRGFTTAEEFERSYCLGLLQNAGDERCDVLTCDGKLRLCTRSVSESKGLLILRET